MNSVCVDFFDHFSDASPQGQVCEHLHDAALIREGRLLQHGQIFHHAVVNDELPAISRIGEALERDGGGA